MIVMEIIYIYGQRYELPIIESQHSGVGDPTFAIEIGNVGKRRERKG